DHRRSRRHQRREWLLLQPIGEPLLQICCRWRDAQQSIQILVVGWRGSTNGVSSTLGTRTLFPTCRRKRTSRACPSLERGGALSAPSPGSPAFATATRKSNGNHLFASHHWIPTR